MNTLIPLIWAVISALVYWLMGYLFGSFGFYTGLITILWCVILFGFGMTLARGKRNNRTWVRKLIIALVVVLVMFSRLNLISLGGFNLILDRLYITRQITDLLLVYCGWAFFL